jgi:hypothetical protein
MMTRTMSNDSPVVCGIPLDAEYFDVSGFVADNDLPTRGEQRVLASFQLHQQYCGVLTYFAQFTDLYARDNSQIRTPGFEWLILQNGKPLFPYTRLELIVNPWGYNCLPVAVRLDENAKVEFIIRNRSADNTGANSIDVFAGRIVGYYWYNEIFGGRNAR